MSIVLGYDVEKFVWLAFIVALKFSLCL